MSTFNGTDDQDTIDGGALPDGTIRIDPKAGDDTLINLTSIEVIAGPGNDNISGADVRYALWRAPNNPTVNLKEGFALDGFGSRDQLSGVTTVQLPSNALSPKDSTVIGSNQDETVYVWAGNNTISLGGGTDSVRFYDSDYSDFSINLVDSKIVVKNKNTNSISNI